MISFFLKARVIFNHQPGMAMCLLASCADDDAMEQLTIVCFADREYHFEMLMGLPTCNKQFQNSMN